MADPGPSAGLHRFAVATAAATLLLIAAGGLVTSTESGLSVPDWPTTYGQNPFTFPISKWVGGIRFEHSHRLIASAVGLLTVFLAVWLQRREDRLWVRRLGWAALAAVVAQGVLGGLTVLFLLPTPVSVAHACLAQTFFCLVVTLAIVTSPRFRAAEAAAPSALSRAAAWTTGLVFLQLLAGAVMRHTKAGLAIPDFPLALGRVVPPIESFAVAIHFAHRLGALLVAAAAAVSVTRAARSGRPALAKLGGLLALAVCAQIALGALTVLSKKDVILTTAHVATGAIVLGVSLGLAIASRRFLPGSAGATVAAARSGRPEASPAPARTATEALSWK
jgi:cytochrome c oxidase assembly protein subunit 15